MELFIQDQIAYSAGRAGEPASIELAKVSERFWIFRLED